MKTWCSQISWPRRDNPSSSLPNHSATPGGPATLSVNELLASLNATSLATASASPSSAEAATPCTLAAWLLQKSTLNSSADFSECTVVPYDATPLALRYAAASSDRENSLQGTHRLAETERFCSVVSAFGCPFFQSTSSSSVTPNAFMEVITH